MTDELLPLKCPTCGKPLRAELTPDGYVDVCSEHGRLAVAIESPQPIDQLNEIDRTLADIRQELDAQFRRMAQLQQQVNDLRAKSKRR